MTIELEEIISVPGRYNQISVTDDKIVGLRLSFGEQEQYIDYLTDQGKLVKQMGKDWRKTFMQEKVLNKDLNPLKDPSGNLPLFQMIGNIISFVPQVIYNAATCIPENIEVEKFKKDSQYLLSPRSIACSKDKTFVLDFGCTYRNHILWFEEINVPSITIYNGEKSGLKKLLTEGNNEGEIKNDPHSIGMSEIFTHEDSLYLLKENIYTGFQLLEFDLEANFKRTIFDANVSARTTGYSDFAIDESGIYFVVKAKSRMWNSVLKLDFNGSFELYDLSDDLCAIDGITVSDDRVYVRRIDEILRYDKKMELVKKVKVPELTQRTKLISSHSFARNLEYHPEFLYLAGCDLGGITHHLDGHTTKTDGYNDIMKFRV